MLKPRIVLSVLVLLNVVVLAGQVWPTGAPPFARWVNIAFLVASLAYFLTALGGGRQVPPPAGPRPDRGRDG